MIPDSVLPDETRETFVAACFLSGRLLTGHVVDRGDIEREFVVELLIDGWPLAITRAHCFDAYLARSEDAILRDAPWHGFVFNVPDTILATGTIAEVRLANTDRIVGTPLRLDTTRPTEPALAWVGSIAWMGGLRFEGWLAPSPDGENVVRCLIDEDIVTESESSGWTLIQIGGEAIAKPKLDLHLPDRYADGRVHRLDVIDADGQALAGSPLVFVAYADGLERFLDRQADIESERLRARLFDELMPRSIPFSRLAGWMQLFPHPHLDIPVHETIAVILVGDGDVDASVASLQASPGAWVVGALPGDPATGRFAPDDLAQFLDDLDPAVRTVVVTLGGAIFMEGAMSSLAAAVRSGDGAPIAYADVILRMAADADLPLAFPAFDYERMLEQGFAGLLFATDRDMARDAAGAGADSVFRLFDHCLGWGGPGFVAPDHVAPVHVAAFLARLPPLDLIGAGQALREATALHLAARGIAAELLSKSGHCLPSVQVRRATASKHVSIIIPTRDRLDDLRATIDGLSRLSTRHALDLVVVDVASGDAASRHFLETLKGPSLRLLRLDGYFNEARAFNEGVGAANGELIALLKSGVVIKDDDWLDELVARCAEPPVAAAGGVVYANTGHVANAGLVLGPNFGVGDVGAGLWGAESGYGDLLSVACRRSALSSAAMVTKRDAFLAAGGFDQRVFPRFLFAVDYALKLRAAERQLVFTPHVGATQPFAVSPHKPQGPQDRDDFERELTSLRFRWGQALMDDPFYSPSLALNGHLHAALACPPRRGTDARRST